MEQSKQIQISRAAFDYLSLVTGTGLKALVLKIEKMLTILKANTDLIQEFEITTDSMKQDDGNINHYAVVYLEFTANIGHLHNCTVVIDGRDKKFGHLGLHGIEIQDVEGEDWDHDMEYEAFSIEIMDLEKGHTVMYLKEIEILEVINLIVENSNRQWPEYEDGRELRVDIPSNPKFTLEFDIDRYN